MYTNKCKVCGTIDISEVKRKYCDACGSNKIIQLNEKSWWKRPFMLWLPFIFLVIAYLIFFK